MKTSCFYLYNHVAHQWKAFYISICKQLVKITNKKSQSGLVTGERINKMGKSHKIEYYATIKIEFWTHEMRWMKRSQTKKTKNAINCMIIFIRHSRQNYI